MYYVRYKKYSNKERLLKFREALLNRIQYQTRRNMISVLQTIRRLRYQKNLTVSYFKVTQEKIYKIYKCIQCKSGTYIQVLY